MKQFGLRYLLVLVVLLAGFVSAQSQVPTELTAKANIFGNYHASVSLDWKYQTTSTVAAVKFAIYRHEGVAADTAAYKKIYIGYTRSFVDNVVELNKTYTYYVTAVTSQGESAPSNKAEVSLVPPPPPAKAVVTGTITDEATGTPLKHAYVNFFMGNAFSTVITYTDSLGKFKASLNVGKYRLYTSAMGYTPEYYNNKATLSLADTLTFAANDSVDLSVALTAIVPPVTYTLKGSVKDASGNAIKANVRVYKVRLNSYFSTSREVRTDSLGNYSVSVRKGDTVVVYAYPQNKWVWNAQYYNNKTTIAEADRVAIADNVTGINFVLTPKPVYPNGVAGVVKDTLGAGVEALVNAFPKKLSHSVPGFASDFRTYTIHTDSLGSYAFTNMLPAQYYFLAIPKAGYKPSYFKYDGSSTMNWRKADSVVVDSASLVTNINIVVKSLPDSGFGTISGKVRDNSGKTVTGAFVYAISSSGEVYATAMTNSNGQYVLSGLVPDQYAVISDKESYSQSTVQVTAVDYAASQSPVLNFSISPDGTNAVINTGVGTVSNYTLSQNYPNPFNPTTVISYQIPSDAKVVLKVYNILGKEVATLVNGNQAAGKYNVTFNGSNLASGVYLYKLEAGNFSATKKLVLMK
ncbi:MAG: carboxypeptidase regulatory-like domain-containing protein [Ignavibacteria bacterium]|nr:carboxypeptidase regulatory-like domain-containing protein [Ignavibacteria bacterium]